MVHSKNIFTLFSSRQLEKIVQRAKLYICSENKRTMIDYLFCREERIICVKEIDSRTLPDTVNQFYKVRSNKRVRFRPGKIKLRPVKIEDENKVYKKIIMNYRRLFEGDLI